MILAVQPPDGAWEWFFGWADVAGGFGAVIAIGFALAALRDGNRARREAIDERRRLFELSILRELLTGIDNGFLYRISDDPERLREFARRLDLLPGSDLPFWREMFSMRYPGDVTRYMGLVQRQQELSVQIGELAKSQPPPDAPAAEQAVWDEAHEQATTELRASADAMRERVSDRLLAELVDAITCRVEAGTIKSRKRC